MKTAKEITEEEKNLIASWYVNGKNSNTIAKEFHISPNRVMEIVKEKGKTIHNAGCKRMKDRPMMAPAPSTKKDPLMPPVGNEWKPWMIPTDIIIPEDTSTLNWEEYAKDYDRRKKICDERNALLCKNHKI